MDFDDMTDNERRAIIRSRIQTADEATIRLLWRILLLPQRDVVQDAIYDGVREPVQNGHEAGDNGKTVG